MNFSFVNKKFAPGDRVVYTYSGSHMVSRGETGTVVCIDNGCSIGVCWDKEDWRKHNCGGLCERGHGYWVVSIELQKIF